MRFEQQRGSERFVGIDGHERHVRNGDGFYGWDRLHGLDRNWNGRDRDDHRKLRKRRRSVRAVPDLLRLDIDMLHRE